VTSNYEHSRGRHRRRRRALDPDDRIDSGLDAPDGWRDYRRRPRGRILGVCAWLARYFDVETWVVRVAAITGLIFMPQVVFPAYIVAGIMLRVHERWEREAAWQAERTGHSPGIEDVLQDAAPTIVLRDAEARMRQMELKLRRMEAHVTSGHFELQREFNRLDHH
jgi:phage shock protein C